MSDQIPLLPQDVGSGNDMDAWFSMLSCIVNFLSAAANLAVKLEQNYLINNVTELKKPTLPLLPAPSSMEEDAEEMQIASTQLEENVQNLIAIRPGQSENIEADETSVNNVVDEEYVAVSEHIPILLTYPESECSDLPQEVTYVNTQDMGDFGSANLQHRYAEYNSNEDHVMQPENYLEDVDGTQEPEETIKICSSEDICYFDDYTDSEQTIGSVSLQKQYEQITENENPEHLRGTSKVEEIQCEAASSLVEDKCVQAKKKKSGDGLPKIAKPIKTQEIQTSCTNRFKGRLMDLITKSPELQQPIKEAMVEKTKTPIEKPTCKHSTVAKNINELKEQLDSIKMSPNKTIPKEHNQQHEKRCPPKSSKIPVDKNNTKRCKKIEKQTLDIPNASTCSNHIPQKSPGTTKRFASVESVVKKLIHRSKVAEKDTEDDKNIKKICTPIQRDIKKFPVKQQGIEEEKKPVEQKPVTSRQQCPLNEFKTVKNHKDFIYKKNIVLKTEKPKTPTCQNRPETPVCQHRAATKRPPSRKSSDRCTARSRSPSRCTRGVKNTNATAEAARKKEKELKKSSPPSSAKVRSRNAEEVCDV